MNLSFLFSIVLSIFMGAAATPTNETISAFIQEANKEAGQEVATYEETPFGNAVVFTVNIPGVSTADLQEMPTDMMKQQFVQGLKGDSDSAEFINVLVEENTNIIMRLVCEDGGSVELFVTPADLK